MLFGLPENRYRFNMLEFGQPAAVEAVLECVHQEQLRVGWKQSEPSNHTLLLAWPRIASELGRYLAVVRLDIRAATEVLQSAQRYFEVMRQLPAFGPHAGRLFGVASLWVDKRLVARLMLIRLAIHDIAAIELAVPKTETELSRCTCSGCLNLHPTNLASANPGQEN